MEGSCPADILEKLVLGRLGNFGLELKKNIVGCTNDRSSEIINMNQVYPLTHSEDENNSEIYKNVDKPNNDYLDDYLDGLTLEKYTTNLDLSKNNRY
ncbi:hypothetical protein BB559_003100 [Furculomyces boomerangus]|uniref:Uncharacterized protein n=1 Tax=Furculomyces boomerangus TaxID=61424 RepID=A0A2T9YP62_9FUNG|nr:hypothetical protein BB559_003100 [Furculomyces boomerangus]